MFSQYIIDAFYTHHSFFQSINQLMNSMVHANQRIAQNYLKNASGYHHDVRDIGITYTKFFSKVVVHPISIFKIYELQLGYLANQQKIWQHVFLLSETSLNLPIIEPKKGDKRFYSADWTDHKWFNFIKQHYLLYSKLLCQIINEIEVDVKNRKKLDFYTGQYMSAFSPTNFLFTNPDALKLAIETNGKSLLDGIDNLVKDLDKGRVTQVDDKAFEVGKNLAITPGYVIYENDLMQLIQYIPVTKKQYGIPLLIVPPWINKFYILDLQQKNSFVNFLIEQGISVYMISWRNPNSGMGHISLEDYVEKGALKAIEVVKDVSNSDKVNVLGYCLGGTLLSIACAILSANQKEISVNSATFLAAMVDFSDIGPMGDVVDCALIRKLERGELLHNGVLNGHDMETAFNLIRPNDLIWSYVVNNYLNGKKPSAFDVIYWTNDNTNLPADMYIYYMKHIILENKLSRKHALHICNTPIDIGKIKFPVIVIGFKDDTISPAATVFTTSELVDGHVEFILGGSGHVMGVVNPPALNKYGYYLNGKLGNGFDEWKKTSQYHEGSWWTVYINRLLALSGNEIESSDKIGNSNYPHIEAAPGRFVMEKC